MIEDNVTQNAAPARSRYFIEPLLSVSYTANFVFKTGVLRVKIFPNYACYICIINHLARSGPIPSNFRFFLFFGRSFRQLVQEKTVNLFPGDRAVVWICSFF